MAGLGSQCRRSATQAGHKGPRGASVRSGGHSLKSVCERELGILLDKSEQVSDWSRRPLSERQVAYAALDAEVLLQLYARFGQPSVIREGHNLELAYKA